MVHLRTKIVDGFRASMLKIHIRYFVAVLYGRLWGVVVAAILLHIGEVWQRAGSHHVWVAFDVVVA